MTHANDMLRAGPIAVAIDASDAADAALTIGIALARARTIRAATPSFTGR